jgi:hypothetical protein
MRKLDRLKFWYTLPKAAKRLTITLSESITENDLIQSAAEGYLTPSWFITDKHKFSAFEVTAIGSPVLDEDGDRNEGEVFGLFNLPTHIYPPWIFGLLALSGKGLAPEHGRIPIIFNPENKKYFALESPYNYDTDKFLDFPSKEDLVITQKDLDTFEQGMKALGEDSIAPFSTPIPFTQLNKGRRDILDPVIDEAIGRLATGAGRCVFKVKGDGIGLASPFYW